MPGIDDSTKAAARKCELALRGKRTIRGWVWEKGLSFMSNPKNLDLYSQDRDGCAALLGHRVVPEESQARCTRCRWGKLRDPASRHPSALRVVCVWREGGNSQLDMGGTQPRVIYCAGGGRNTSVPPHHPLVTASRAALVALFGLPVCLRYTAVMGAHRRRILRQRGTRKRHAKSPDTTSLEGDPDCGDDSSSLGSSCWEEPAQIRLSRGTLIRHHPVSCSSSDGTDNGNRRMVPPYHPGAACAEMVGYAGRLSSSHEVLPPWVV